MMGWDFGVSAAAAEAVRILAEAQARKMDEDLFASLTGRRRAPTTAGGLMLVDCAGCREFFKPGELKGGRCAQCAAGVKLLRG